MMNESAQVLAPNALNNTRNYPNWIAAFIDHASYGEAPLQFYYWTAVSTIAGALRRCVWVEQVEFQWYPNFYIILVAPPGVVAKSTTSSIGMKLLRNVPGVRFGPDAVTWPALSKSLADNVELVNMGNDIYMPMSAITIESSEFGVFLNTDDRQMIDVLVTLWDGKQLHKSTKSQGEEVVENPYVNIIACTTPGWIEGNFPEYMIGGGFTSRCLFVYGDKKRQLVPYLEKVVPKDHAETKRKLTEDLERMSLLRGRFELTPDAFQFGAEWYIRINTHRPPHLDNERFGGYLIRKQTSLHKLAMIISASQGDSKLITRAHLEEADIMLTTLEGDMVKVFDRIGRTDNTRGQHEILSVLRVKRSLPVNTLYKEVFRTLSWNDFKISLDSAVQAGFVKMTGTEVIYCGKD